MFSNIFGQINPDSNSKLLITKSKEIKRIFNTYNEAQNKKVYVFTIQLFHNESRYAVSKVRNEYEKLFPGNKTDFFYEAPYFKVSSEYFLKKLVAQQKLDSIKNNFPDAFIIKKTIPFKEF